MNTWAAIANSAWFAASIPEWLRFRRAASRVEATQRDMLQSYLQTNADTEFGHLHDFGSIRSWEEYADRIPLRTYDQSETWIRRIAAGEPGILTADPVTLLEPTSGSSGGEKWVPYTRTLRAEFRRAVAVWITGTFIENPGLLGGRAYWSLTPQVATSRETETKIPVGFEDDSAYLGGLTQHLISRALVIPPNLSAAGDMDRFWHLSLIELLRCRDLRLVSVWHPSFILLLLKHLRGHWAELLQDLTTHDKARAAELEVLGPNLAPRLWPHLGLISCWGDAQASGCLPEIRSEFPGVTIQPKGLVATEAFCTLPLGDLHPLAIRSHFFEFRDSEGNVLPAWSLRESDSYSMIVTTGGGLYRYELRDQVKVTGFHDEIPSLTFIGKEDSVADHYGEKLSEAFVTESMAKVFSRHALEPAFAMLALDPGKNAPAYVLYIESAKPPNDGVIDELDSELRRNPHYDLCISLGQLEPLRVFHIPAGAYRAYSGVLMKRGMRLGDIKPASLSRLTSWSQHFAGIS
jgi:hypothetical protein